MKRLGKIFDFMISEKNLTAAHFDLMQISRKCRKAQAVLFSQNLEKNIRDLHEELVNGEWIMGNYTSLTRREGGKVREIWYDSRYSSMVVQHAIGRTIGTYLIKSFIPETYASITGRGIHRAVKYIRRHIKTYAENSPIYIFKCDIKHFYPSIDKEVLKNFIRGKIKARRACDLLCRCIIDTFPQGLPIGNYVSPLLANFYLNELDHIAKERYRFKGYFRYLDDIVIISDNKDRLWQFSRFLQEYAKNTLHVKIKHNWQIFPIERYGLDFLGYVFRRHDIRLRQSVARRFRHVADLFIRNRSSTHRERLASYWGWLKHSTGGMKLWHNKLQFPIKQLNQPTRKEV